MSKLPRTAPAQQPESFGDGRFMLKRRLGEGSMGAVYLAYDNKRAADVALKTLRRADATSIYRFKREFRALSDLVHPNLVALYDLFHEGDLYYFTMEHVHGRDFLTYVLGASRHAFVDTPRFTPEEAFDFGQSESDMRVLQTRGLEMLFPTPLQDEDRLRDVLAQIAQGLLAIHTAGKLHRDLKSDNVLVTDDGRAKVLDFGIAIERVPGVHGTLDHGVMGTPAYMSPEQAAGRAVDEATDWYALGVMLYEALTGNVPFDGDYLEIMHQKQHVDPPPPSQVVSGVPRDLDELCRRLLDRTPNTRPDGGAVLRALEYRRAPSMRPPPTSSSVPAEPDAPFVGRHEELVALRRHLAQTDRGKPVVSLIAGPSGIGKTTLVERYLGELRTAQSSVVLRGRCYERESVPFKAFDTLIDSLSRHLRRLHAVDAAEVLPRDIPALAQLFPVLKRVDVVAMVKRRTPLPSDRQELRARAFGALRELLRRLADRMPLVLFIDDLQWGDVDSAQLIVELLRAPDAPSMQLLLSYRSGEANSSPCLQTLFAFARAAEDFDMHELLLQPLSQAESVELAQRLLGAAPAGAARGIGIESQGNPHWLTELVRHVARGKQSAQSSPDTQRGIVSFERALAQRVSDLSLDARTLLELLSVAGRPVPEENLAFVSSFDIDLQHAVTELRGAKLVRGVGTHARRAIETYHDRIREGVVAAMAPDRLQLWHKRLATTFEATGEGDLEAIVEHLIGAGDSKRAQIYAIRAATQAADALAFEKAARLFAIAVENQDDHGWGHELLVRWADALVNAGHGRQAAAVYLDASRSASEPEATAFRRKAGLHLLATGHHDEALEVLDGTLAQLGVDMTASAQDSSRELNALRQRIEQRGFSLGPRVVAVHAPATLERHDMLWTLALYLAQVEPERALPLVARCLLDAFDLGEPMRVVRSACLYHVAIELPLGSNEGQAARAALTAVEKLEHTLEDPEAQARVAFVHGLEALGRGQWKPTTRALVRAAELLRTSCRGAAPEMRLCRTALAYTLVSFLQLERLHGIEAWADDAEEHEDLLAGTRLRLLTTLGALAANAPERAERALGRAIARWDMLRPGPIAVVHAQARTMLALYRADAVGCSLALSAYELFFASSLASVPQLRADALLWRARAALVATHDGSTRDALFDAVEQDAQAIAALRIECFEPRVRLLRAGLAARRGDRELALTLLDAVLADPAEQPDMLLMHAAAERRRGELLGGEQGQALIAYADAKFSAQGVANPRAFACLLAPGFASD